MNGYNAPSFQDRASASLQAKQKALAAMKAVPQRSAAELAERAAQHARRDALAKTKAANARQARDDKQRLADEKRAAKKADGIKLEQPKKTEAELKAARDARYAARKNRK
jgi:hypothetical protein